MYCERGEGIEIKQTQERCANLGFTCLFFSRFCFIILTQTNSRIRGLSKNGKKLKRSTYMYYSVGANGIYRCNQWETKKRALLFFDYKHLAETRVGCWFRLAVAIAIRYMLIASHKRAINLCRIGLAYTCTYMPMADCGFSYCLPSPFAMYSKVSND